MLTAHCRVSCQVKALLVLYTARHIFDTLLTLSKPGGFLNAEFRLTRMKKASEEAANINLIPFRRASVFTLQRSCIGPLTRNSIHSTKLQTLYAAQIRDSVQQ